MTDIQATIMVLKEQRASFIPYIRNKLRDEEKGNKVDWHSIQDACFDIREIEAKIEALEMLAK